MASNTIVSVKGEVIVPDPPIAQALYASTRWEWLWLIVRVYVGWQWLTSSWAKISGGTWAGGEALMDGAGVLNVTCAACGAALAGGEALGLLRLVDIQERKTTPRLSDRCAGCQDCIFRSRSAAAAVSFAPSPISSAAMSMSPKS